MCIFSFLSRKTRIHARAILCKIKVSLIDDHCSKSFLPIRFKLLSILFAYHMKNILPKYYYGFPQLSYGYAPKTAHFFCIMQFSQQANRVKMRIRKMKRNEKETEDRTNEMKEPATQRHNLTALVHMCILYG